MAALRAHPDGTDAATDRLRLSAQPSDVPPSGLLRASRRATGVSLSITKSPFRSFSTPTIEGHSFVLSFFVYIFLNKIFNNS